jgi:light-regulated signal transduction histidine kinase (bacteriophytochrome)
MDQLTIGLLALSRVARSELTMGRLDMTALARSVYSELAEPGEEPGLTVSIAPLHPAWGDATLMRQVWINLISNAIKYTRPKPARLVNIDSYARNGMIVYSVRDNGVGFDPGLRHKLFGVFQRLHNTADFEGTGIGLAIVQRIILRHGGRVWAEGAIGQGATFYFSLPQETGP